MKYYIIAGEASGDLHASNLMKELKRLDAQAHFRFWGGEKMQAVGGELVRHYRDISFMGFWEVARNARRLSRYLKECREDIRSWHPDVLVPVDSPGFNLRMSRFASRLGIPVCYYISPQLWAWKSGRVKTVKEHVKRMITILPFETEFYSRHGYAADYVGHPLLDVIDPSPQDLTHTDVIAVLPGSRYQEIVTTLPVFALVADRFPQYRFVVCGVPTIEAALYSKLIAGHRLELVVDQTAATLRRSAAALVTSGTATLEAALLNVPQVVCYKGGAVSYFIGKRLVKVDFIALVNLIMGQAIVKELIQRDFTMEKVAAALNDVLDGTARRTLLKQYAELRQKLGGAGASARAAAIVYSCVQGSARAVDGR
jgi:lipid-A-disaccharide synthase